MHSPPAVFIDYQVIDHLHRLDTGRYSGRSADSLRRFRSAAELRTYDLWMAEITQVEMIIGRENPNLHAARLPEILSKDANKLQIASAMGVRWLAYQCSKFNGDYSRLDISFRFAGPNWEIADALERRLELVSGVSRGDARQIVSLLYGFDVNDATFHPDISWFVTEDEDLRGALPREVAAGRLHDLAGVRIGSVADLLAAQPAAS
jgi:hypothetical protein